MLPNQLSWPQIGTASFLPYSNGVGSDRPSPSPASVWEGTVQGHEYPQVWFIGGGHQNDSLPLCALWPAHIQTDYTHPYIRLPQASLCCYVSLGPGAHLNQVQVQMKLFGYSYSQTTTCELKAQVLCSLLPTQYTMARQGQENCNRYSPSKRY